MLKGKFLINKQSVEMLLLLLVLMGHILVHSVLSQWPIYVMYGILIVIFLLWEKRIVIRREMCGYYLLFISAIVLSLILRPSYKTVVYLAIALVTIIVYERITAVRIDKPLVERFCLLLMIAMLSYPSYLEGRLQSFLLNPNALALVVIFITFIVWTSSNKVIRYVGSALILILTYLIGSKALVLFLICFLVLLNIKKDSTFTGLTLLIIVLCLGFVDYTLNADQSALYTLFSQYSDIELFGRGIFLTANRNFLWDIALASIRENPFGIGIGNTGELMLRQFGYPLSPHNTFLYTALEGGWPLLLSYLLILMKMYKGSSRPVRAYLIAVHVHSLFESALPYYYDLGAAILVLPYYFSYRKDINRKEWDK